MTEQTSSLNLELINQTIADRTNVFYWQTDRDIDPAQAGAIWADRHRYFSDAELTSRVNGVLDTDTVTSIEPLDLEAQTNLGNVSSVRTGVLASGAEIIMRNFPKGIKNGYFHVEATAAQKASEAGLPSYKTLAIHDFAGGDDYAFSVIEKLPGTAITKWLEVHPEDEDKLVHKAGAMMARLHQVPVTGFGPFDNEKAKYGELVGLHDSYADAVRAGLEFNLDVLYKEGVFTGAQVDRIRHLFGDDNPLLQVDKAVLVHNDFADWNLLTDGEDISAILDWDECVGGTAISDIACWSTFFDPKRMSAFLEGYFTVAEKPADFEAKFELLRLRYTISKMTLRLRRYSWEPSDIIKQRIETGKTHLAASLDYFEISTP